MKTINVTWGLTKCILIACICINSVQAQVAMCCQKPTGMTALAMNESFVQSHAEPLRLEYSAQGNWIDIKCADGKTARGYLIKSSTPTNNWLIVCHEFWGLNSYILKRSDELQTELPGVNVLALDFYDGKVTDKRDSAAYYMSHAAPERIKNILDGAVAYCGSAAHIVSIGWCFGGMLSVQAAAAAGVHGIGCVTYYGLPDTKTYDATKPHCDIDGFFAGKDDWINAKVISDFDAFLKQHHKTMTYKTYPEAYHAFANPSNPKYDKDAATDANARALVYIKQKFGIK